VDPESTVKKGYHRAWQIHYHIVLLVKYRKFLLDEEVVRIIHEDEGDYFRDGPTRSSEFYAEVLKKGELVYR